MVVAGVKRKAVEPAATTGLSQAGKLEAVEMANFGSDGLPSSQGVLTVLCRSLEILDALWYDCCIGHLNDMAQKYLVTKDILKEFDLTELKLTTIILMEEEYIVARKFFLQSSGEHIQSISESCLKPNK